MKSLYRKLKAYCSGETYPLHMPGHKRNLKLFDDAYSIDITEIDSFDDLHHSNGIIKDAMDEMADIYGSDKTFILVNGSTCGILASICACTNPGDKILLARNCHKSVYNALFIRSLNPIYVYPETDCNYGFCKSVNPDQIKNALENNKDIKAVVITSPTYEGILSDIKSISLIAHSYNIPLIVDEAHGAHFSYGTFFPESAINSGADIVIQSLHKTLPALTQTAVLHIKSDLINSCEVQRYLSIFQTSSPSYVLMSSAIECVKYMKENGDRLVENFYGNLTSLRSRIKKLSSVHLYENNDDIFDYDISKLVFSVNGMSGKELMSILRQKYKLELEMAAGNYVISMTSVSDTPEGLAKFYNALYEIDSNNKDNTYKSFVFEYFRKAEYIKSPYEASLCDSIYKPYRNAVNEISAETLYLYPPGIPIVVAGERINEELINIVKKHEAEGFSVYSDFRKPGQIKCLI